MKKVWLAPLMVLVILGAQVAEGGIISTLSNILNVSSSAGLASSVLFNETVKRPINLQNFKLPEPELELSQKEINSGEQIIANGSAMSQEIGPSGLSSSVSDNKAPSDLISVYTVRPGDNISTIAEMFNVSANTIRWANDLRRNDVLREGDTLIILPITGIKHIVKKGDTIQSIAKKYQGDLDEIINYNGLDPKKDLLVGETVVIPDGQDGTIISGTKASTPSKKVIAPSAGSGYFMWPVAGGRKSQGLHGHNAIDIAAPMGTPVYAAAAGRVILARSSGWNGGYGNYVIISHANGTQTLYSHFTKVYVTNGQQVSKGEQIGTIGNTGRSTGYHLHFEVRGAANPF